MSDAWLISDLRRRRKASIESLENARRLCDSRLVQQWETIVAGLTELLKHHGVNPDA